MGGGQMGGYGGQQQMGMGGQMGGQMGQQQMGGMGGQMGGGQMGGYGGQQQMGMGGQMGGQMGQQQMGGMGGQMGGGQQEQQMGGGGGYGNNNMNDMKQNEQIEMQAMGVNILDEFFGKVPVETFYQMCPIGNDGAARTDFNRSRLMVAKYRGVNPMEVDENDEAIAHFENLTINELREQLMNLPKMVHTALRGAGASGYMSGNDNDREIDFLTDFAEKVNLKQIYGKLQQDLGVDEPGLDKHHARIVVANLRDATFGQVTEQDPGVQLVVDKTMMELRVYLSTLPMADLRLLDLKSYHKYANGDAAAPKKGGIQFPTIRLNFNGDTREFQPQKFGCFDEIMGFIASQWQSLQQYSLMYQNDDQWVRVTTNIVIQKCIKVAVDTNQSYFIIMIMG
eukprot:228539_1